MRQAGGNVIASVFVREQNYAENF